MAVMSTSLEDNNLTTVQYDIGTEAEEYNITTEIDEFNITIALEEYTVTPGTQENDITTATREYDISTTTKGRGTTVTTGANNTTVTKDVYSKTQSTGENDISYTTRENDRTAETEAYDITTRTVTEAMGNVTLGESSVTEEARVQTTTDSSTQYTTVLEYTGVSEYTSSKVREYNEATVVPTTVVYTAPYRLRPLHTTTVGPVVYTTDVHRTQSGIPVSIIWVPYVIFSLVLVGLMIVSFVRFHRKNGHKYRVRREAFWRQLNMQNLLRGHNHSDSAASPPNGGLNVPKDSQQAGQPPPAKPKSRGRRSRHPIVFTSNLNGSMVDVRCGEHESLRTFKPKNHGKPSSVWVLPQYKRHGFFTPPGRSQIVTHSDADGDHDDQVYLLQQQQQQTRL